jgi:hypothetical protein
MMMRDMVKNMRTLMIKMSIAAPVPAPFPAPVPAAAADDDDLFYYSFSFYHYAGDYGYMVKLKNPQWTQSSLTFGPSRGSAMGQPLSCCCENTEDDRRSDCPKMLGAQFF